MIPFSHSSYQPGRPEEEEPPILYYNAWSLPTQKCYVSRSGKLNETNITDETSEHSEHYINPNIGNSGSFPHIPTPPHQTHYEPIDFSQINMKKKYQNLFLTEEQ